VKEHFENWRRDAAAWVRKRGLELWILTGFWAVLTLVIYLLATGHESPRRYQDEFLFWALAKNFAGGEGLTWRGQGLGMFSWLYPVLLAPAFWVAGSVPGQYTLVHLINSMMICGVLYPAYLWARLYVGRWQSVLAALMVASVPAMNYAGVIGTENLGYPMFTAACGAMLLALVRPRLRNALLAFVLIGLAMLTRTQFVVLGPIFAGTLLLTAAMAGPGRRVEYLRRRQWVWGGLLLGALLAFLFYVSRGRGVFGLYAGAFEGVPLTFENVWFWLKGFTADLYLLAAIVPTIATFAMFGAAENRRDAKIGPLIALALVASLVLVAQITWFSATNPYDWRGRHIFYERYMFYLGPIYFIGLFAAWKRVSPLAAVISSLVAMVIVSGMPTDAVMRPFSYDSFGLSLVGWYMDGHPARYGDQLSGGTGKIGMDLARLTILLGVLYVLSCLPGRTIRKVFHSVVIVVVFVLLIATQAQTWHYARTFSTAAFESYPKPANFIDKATDQDVGMIITSTDDPLSYFTAEFWNNRVVRAFASDAPPIKTPIMYSPKCEFDWDKTGKILGTGCDKVPTAWYLRSDNVAMHVKDEYKRVHPGPAWPNLTLMEGKAPARILSLIDGRQVRTGMVQAQLNVRTFLDSPGRIRVKLQGLQDRVVVTLGGKVVLVGPSSRRTVNFSLGRNEEVSVIDVRTLTGVPAAVTVLGLDVRQGDGPWTSIL
jgi:hypothetical protein